MIKRNTFALLIVAFVLQNSPAKAQTDSAATLQTSMSNVHAQIAALGLRATQNSMVNPLEVETKINSIERSMNAVSQTAGQNQIDYMKKTTREDFRLLVITQEADLLTAEMSAISNYLDTQDPKYSRLVTELEKLVNSIEP